MFLRQTFFLRFYLQPWNSIYPKHYWAMMMLMSVAPHPTGHRRAPWEGTETGQARAGRFLHGFLGWPIYTV